MIESPLIKELVAETKQELILRVLTARFKAVPAEIDDMLRKIDDIDRLDSLTDWAAVCPDLATFQARLTT